MITDDELDSRSKPFIDVSKKFNAKTTFKEAKEAMGNGKHMGNTDVSSSLWHIIKMLRNSITQIMSGNRLFKDIPVYRLPGFYELLVFVTDNDVNSGDQPMDVLNLYWGLVYQAFKLLPFDKDGTRADPDALFKKYVPRMVVIATMGGVTTIGDPRDSRILNICGFDSSAPTLIDTFVNGQSAEIADIPAEDE
jgi:hypothetical protein